MDLKEKQAFRDSLAKEEKMVFLAFQGLKEKQASLDSRARLER